MNKNEEFRHEANRLAMRVWMTTSDVTFPDALRFAHDDEPKWSKARIAAAAVMIRRMSIEGWNSN